MKKLILNSMVVASLAIMAGCDTSGNSSDGAGQSGDTSVDDGAQQSVYTVTEGGTVNIYNGVVPAAESSEEELINGCSVESEEAGDCSRE